MITFKNIITDNIFTLPKAKAISVISLSPDIFEIISGAEGEVLSVSRVQVSKDLSKDIYDLVVQADSSEVSPQNSKTLKKKAPKVKDTKVRRKEK